MSRVHEAVAFACTGCGAPVAVHPAATHGWCATCHVWKPLPDDVRQAAWQRLQAVAQAQAEQQREYQLAQSKKVGTLWQRIQSGAMTVFLAGVFLFFVIPLLSTIAIYAVAAVIVAFDELEIYVAAPLLVVTVLTALALFGAFLGMCAFLYRRLTRHRRWSRMASETEWYGRQTQQSLQHLLVCCGECGAPLSFGGGEQSVQCGYCRAIVHEPEAHGELVISVAYSELQQARRARAREERRLLAATLATRRRGVLVRSWFFAGSIAILALPVLAFGYAIRALTPSLEEAMLSLGKRLNGEFGAGLDPAFDWLDRFWIGETPPTFSSFGMFASRWSVAGVFQGRPVLISVLTSWTDFTAKEAIVLLASPHERDIVRATGSQAASEARALGWEVYVDYAGIALVARSLSQKHLTAEAVTALTRLAYQIAEAR